MSEAPRAELPTPPDGVPRSVVDEPFGHAGPLSKIERAWRDSPAGSALARSRTQRFDTNSSLLYSPVVYEYCEMAAPQQAPDGTWVREAFTEFVRGEFGRGGARLRPDGLGKEVVDRDTVTFDLLGAYLERSELELVYGGLVPSGEQGADDGDMAQAVLDILTHPLLGNKGNAKNVDPDWFRGLVHERVERKDRLAFVVPACPFKDQNPLRTLSGPAYPDAGELSFLVALHILALALYQVHPFGADFVILSDGRLYADIFGISEPDALRYAEHLREFRNRLNLQGTVNILDLADVLDSFAAAIGQDAYAAALEGIRGAVRALAAEVGPEQDAFNVLVRGMRSNVASRDLLGSVDPELAWDVLAADTAENLPPEAKPLWEEIQGRAIEAAVEYAAINLLLKHFDVLHRTFPDALRGTVHPKPGQIALPSHGSMYPWNGVAFKSEDMPGPMMFASHPLYALPTGRELRAVYLEGYSGSDPFFVEAVR